MRMSPLYRIASVTGLLLGLGACGPEESGAFSEPDAQETGFVEEALRLAPSSETPPPELFGTAALTQSSHLVEDFNAYNPQQWWKATGYGNGGVFNVGWKDSNAAYSNGALTLTLNDSTCPGGCSNYPYAGGELRTLSSYGYGSFQVRMRAASGSGAVSSFFTYDDTTRDEVTIEFLGRDTTKMQVNYFTRGVGGHETVIPLGFDAAAADHTYRFIWGPGFIEWFVDGVKVQGEYGARGPLPTTPGRIMMNLWTGTGIDSWTGAFQYTGPRAATYDQVTWDAY